jgi:hypothetical protein
MGLCLTDQLHQDPLDGSKTPRGVPQFCACALAMECACQKGVVILRSEKRCLKNCLYSSSFNSMGTPAYSIFQLGWDTSQLSLSIWLVHQLAFGWDTILFNLSTQLGHHPIKSFNLVETPADSIFFTLVGQ